MFWLGANDTFNFLVLIFLWRKLKESFLGLVRYYVKMVFKGKKGSTYFKIIIFDNTKNLTVLIFTKIKSLKSMIKELGQMELVPRSALVIKGSQTFLDWLKSVDSLDYTDSMLREADVYLLPDFETEAQIEKWLKKNYDTIFADFLFSWYTEQAMWPQNRTFKMFKEWFEYTTHCMVWDVE